MIYSVFIHQRYTGLLLVEVNFKPLDISTDLVPGFITAFKAFLREALQVCEERDMVIQYDNYVMFIVPFLDFDVDITILAERKDCYFVELLYPYLENVVKNHYEDFLQFEKTQNIHTMQELKEKLMEMFSSRELGNIMKIPHQNCVNIKEKIRSI